MKINNRIIYWPKLIVFVFENLVDQILMDLVKLTSSYLMWYFVQLINSILVGSKLGEGYEYRPLSPKWLMWCDILCILNNSPNSWGVSLFALYLNYLGIIFCTITFLGTILRFSSSCEEINDEWVRRHDNQPIVYFVLNESDKGHTHYRQVDTSYTYLTGGPFLKKDFPHTISWKVGKRLEDCQIKIRSSLISWILNIKDKRHSSSIRW